MVRLWMIPLLVLVAQSGSAQNWPQWRGPTFNGATDVAGLPDRLDPDSNLVWKIEMPGLSSGTPIVWGDRVFITSLDRNSKELLALCLDAKSGRELWRRKTGEGFVTKDRNNLATPSPITDGKTVWFYYGSGDLVAFDLEGKQLWARNIVSEYGPFNINWLYTSSPLLFDGTLFVQVIHRDVPYVGGPNAPLADSYLLGIDPMTGKNLFRQIRPSPGKSVTKEAYNTPVPRIQGDRKEVLLYGGDCVTAHDPRSGSEIWRFTGWNTRNNSGWRVITSIVLAGEKGIICTPQNTSRVIAFNLGGSGDISSAAKAWENNQANSDAPTPLVYQDNLYVLDGDTRKGVTCIDPANGQTRWITPLASRSLLRSAPTGADGKIYLMNEDAETWVLSAKDGKVLSHSQLVTEGTARASIVAAQSRLFARTGSMLYCFGNP